MRFYAVLFVFSSQHCQLFVIALRLNFLKLVPVLLFQQPSTSSAAVLLRLLKIDKHIMTFRFFSLENYEILLNL